jgi:hypothetical protein
MIMQIGKIGKRNYEKPVIKSKKVDIPTAMCGCTSTGGMGLGSFIQLATNNFLGQ